MSVTAGAFPDVKGSTPISVTGKTPILNVLEPIAEAALAYVLGYPIYGIVIFDKEKLFYLLSFVSFSYILNNSATISLSVMSFAKP